MFDLRSVSLAVGEQHREQLAVTLDPFTVAGEPYQAEPATVPVAFAATRLRRGWVFDEELHASVHGACHRCLGEAVVEIDVDVQEFHALHPDPGSEEEMTCEYLRDDALDTDRMAADAVILAMPVRVLCKEDCRGLCATCGADLNAGPCGCR